MNEYFDEYQKKRRLALLLLSISWTIHILLWPVAISNDRQKPMSVVLLSLMAATLMVSQGLHDARNRG